MEQSKIVGLPDANAVTRGGPRPGVFGRLNLFAPLQLPYEGRMCHYQPTADKDTEYPELTVYRFSHYVDEVRGDVAPPSS